MSLHTQGQGDLAVAHWHLQARIMDILLDAIKLDAAISLPPILHVLSCLARDLQEDFMPHLPRILSTLTKLVGSGTAFLCTQLGVCVIALAYATYVTCSNIVES